MKLTDELNMILKQEKKKPTFSHHHINSYMTNLPIDKDNKELIDILHYFPSYKDYLPLYQEIEFKNGLTIEVKCEMIDDYDLNHGITYRESLFHNHDFFEMVYVYQGQCETIIEDYPLIIHSGELCLFDLQAIHKIIIPNPDSIVFNIIISKEIFNDAFLSMFYDTNFVTSFYLNSIYNISNPQKYVLIPLEESSQFYIHHLILEFIQRNNHYQKMMQSDLTSLLLCMTRYIENDISYQVQNQQDIDTSQILNYIYENYHSMTLKDLSLHFGYSTRTMNRYLKKYLHTTFQNIIKECKLNNAREYLLHSDFSIEHIAEKMGFSDRSHFDKFFKDNYDITPIKYRHKYKQ